MACAIPDLDLGDLSLWLVDINAGPVVAYTFCATISTILQSELVLIMEYFIERNNIVVIIELVDCWEVSVLLAAIEWPGRSGESVSHFLSLNCDNMLSWLLGL